MSCTCRDPDHLNTFTTSDDGERIICPKCGRTYDLLNRETYKDTSP